MSRAFLIAILIMAALVALSVSAMNAGNVHIELAFVRFSGPLGVILVVTFAIGLLAGIGWQARWVSQLLAERGKLRRALRIAESKARAEAASHK